MFFDRSHPTRDLWYYEVSLPEGKKNYTKTQPMPYEAFEDCLTWWHERTENDRAWKVPAAELIQRTADGGISALNLDLKNPRGGADLQHRSPEELIESILHKEQRIAQIMAEIQELIGKRP